MQRKEIHAVSRRKEYMRTFQRRTDAIWHITYNLNAEA